LLLFVAITERGGNVVPTRHTHDTVRGVHGT